jgi:hypothetical protein
MDAWEELPQHEYDRAWALFTATFRFRPSIHREDWPGIVEPVPSVTYDITTAYDCDDPWLRPVRGQLNERMLPLFQKVVPLGGFIYAMDWHVGYRFYPHRAFDVKDVRSWGVCILPHGDYTVFLTADLRHGTFGHPWEGTVSVFGTELLAAVKAKLPELFGRVVRRDGMETPGNAP